MKVLPSVRSLIRRGWFAVRLPVQPPVRELQGHLHESVRRALALGYFRPTKAAEVGHGTIDRGGEVLCVNLRGGGVVRCCCWRSAAGAVLAVQAAVQAAAVQAAAVQAAAVQSLCTIPLLL
jgi:hypothetical protein